MPLKLISESRKLDTNIRFDVVSIMLKPGYQSIDHIEMHSDNADLKGIRKQNQKLKRQITDEHKQKNKP